MWTTTNDSKCCATCSNWGGEREVKHSTFVETPDASKCGSCYAGGFCGSAQGPCAFDGRSCAEYKKWAALK